MEVLLIEDHPEDAVVVRRQLLREAADYIDVQLTHVETLTDALKEIAKTHFDVVLLDLGLPDGRGLGNLRRIHQVNPNVPVVILSGVEDEQTAALAVQGGAHAYVVKRPIDRAEALLPILAEATTAQSIVLGDGLPAILGTGQLRLDPELRVTQWDSSCSALLQWEARQLIGKPLTDLAGEHRRAEFVLALQNARPKSPPIKLRLAHPDGRLRTVELRQVGQDNGQTEWSLRAAEDTLRAQQAMQVVDVLLESTRDLVLSQDLDGVIHASSRSSDVLLGRDLKRMLRSKFVDLFASAERESVGPILAAVRRGRVIRGLDTVLEHTDGTELPMSMTLTPLRDEFGGLIGACVIASPRAVDLREDQHARERLMLEERLQRIQEENANLRAEVASLRRALGT